MKHVSLIALSEEGRKRYGEASELFTEAVSITERFGGKMTDVYAVNGRWDFLTVVEYPDPEAAFEARLKILELGIFATIETLEAFDMEFFLAKA